MFGLVYPHKVKGGYGMADNNSGIGFPEREGTLLAVIETADFNLSCYLDLNSVMVCAVAWDMRFRVRIHMS